MEALDYLFWASAIQACWPAWRFPTECHPATVINGIADFLICQWELSNSQDLWWCDSYAHHKCVKTHINNNESLWIELLGGGKRPWSLGPAVAVDPGGGHQLRLQDGPHPSLAHHGAGCPEGCHDGYPGAGAKPEPFLWYKKKVQELTGEGGEPSPSLPTIEDDAALAQLMKVGFI